jgi:hypothetical protein
MINQPSLTEFGAVLLKVDGIPLPSLQNLAFLLMDEVALGLL